MMICRGCGCTDNMPCLDALYQPCGWARPGLCSFCARRRQARIEMAKEALTFFAGVAAVGACLALMWMVAP